MQSDGGWRYSWWGCIFCHWYVKQHRKLLVNGSSLIITETVTNNNRKQVAFQLQMKKREKTCMQTASVERYTVLPTMLFDSLCLNTINDLYSVNTLLSCKTSHYTIRFWIGQSDAICVWVRVTIETCKVSYTANTLLIDQSCSKDLTELMELCTNLAENISCILWWQSKGTGRVIYVTICPVLRAVYR